MENNYTLKPVTEQRADPWVYLHTDGYYYFTASVPEYDRIELRRATEISALDGAEKVVIWTKHETGPMSKHIWAPEIHFLAGKWYIYFAASEVDDIWKLRPYVLECDAENPLDGEWKELGEMGKHKDDKLSFTDFSLDMTIFEHRGKQFAVWAQKTGGQFGPSNLYLAELENPWTLKTIPVMITTPDYDWERIGFWVNEGPAVIKHNGRLFMTFSASATDHNYCMGVLYAEADADLHDPSSWTKYNKPVFGTNERLGLYGPGHNSFTYDKSGNPLCILHARPYKELIAEPLYDPNRHTYVMNVYWNRENMITFGI